MALTKLTADLKNIQKLSDTPNTTEGLTADELKALWDKAGTDIQDYINDILTVELDARHPIGSIYMSTASTNPGTFLPGTWAVWGTGRVPVGVDTEDANFNTVEKEVGASTVTLDTTMIPSHSHTVETGLTEEGQTGIYPSYVTNARLAYYATDRATATGGGLAHNNIQKSITCYMFKRTA